MKGFNLLRSGTCLGKKMIELTIIVPTCNRSGFLKNALSSIANGDLAHERYEVIVIDNGSCDSTREVSNSFSSVISNLVYVYEEIPGLHVGRNLGIELSRGKILAYLDDDVIVSPQWASAIISRFETDTRIALLGGPCLPQWEAPCPNWIENYRIQRDCGGWEISQLSIIDLGRLPKAIAAYDIYGCNFSIRKNILVELGGFHPDGLPERFIKYRGDGETAVSHAIDNGEYIAFYDPIVMVEHCVPASRLTKRYFLGISKRGAISFAYTLFRSHSKMRGFALIRKLFHLWFDFLLASVKRKKELDASDGLSVSEYRYIASWNIAFHFSRIWFSFKLRDWVCQEAYFKKNPTPYITSLKKEC